MSKEKERIEMSIDNALDRFQKMKRDRLAFVVKELYERGGEADLREFRGSLATNYGFNQKTIQEHYFKDLSDSGAITLTGDKIALIWDNQKTLDWLNKKGFMVVDKKKEKSK